MGKYFLFFIFFLFLTNSYAGTIVEVRIPENATLKVISQKYLKNPDKIKELKKYNPGLPEDMAAQIKTGIIKIPAELLKSNVEIGRASCRERV